MPAGHMGRWLGITRFFKMMLSGGLALTAGIIWDTFGPQYIFLAFISIELLIKVPLLITIPETLNKRFAPKEDLLLGS